MGWGHSIKALFTLHVLHRDFGEMTVIVQHGKCESGHKEIKTLDNLICTITKIINTHCYGLEKM